MSSQNGKSKPPPTYPKRPPFFAHQFIRILARAHAANAIGADACWLLTVVAMTEDGIRYSRPVTFFNEQLMGECGYGGRDRLNRARAKCVKSGWLHYEQGGRSVAGIYWVTIPNTHRSDFAVLNQDDNLNTVLNQDAKQDGNQDAKQDSNQDDNAAPFIPIPNPNPAPNLSSETDEESEPKTTPEDVYQYWCNSAATTKPRTLTTDRKSKLRTRLGDPDWPWREAIDQLPIPNTERFIWQPDFDWLIKNSTNAHKLADGEYSRHTSPASCPGPGQVYTPDHAEEFGHGF